MKAVSLQMALPATILTIVLLTIVLLATGSAAKTGAPVHSRHSLQAKIRYCQECHGTSAQGYRGVFPIPRLAGQTTAYIESQLQAFAKGKRGGNIAGILSQTHGDLSPATRAGVAAHFAALNPRPIGGAPRRLVDTGKKIYEGGIPEANVPACSLCHGQDAVGNAANPRLAGQLYPYTVRALANWSADRSNTSSAMASIAKSLTRQQIEAVAAYLGHLK